MFISKSIKVVLVQSIRDKFFQITMYILNYKYKY